MGGREVERESGKSGVEWEEESEWNTVSHSSHLTK